MSSCVSSPPVPSAPPPSWGPRERAAAELELRRRRHLSSFDDWLPRISPTYTWHWPHLVRMRAELDRVSRGEINRLWMFCPPRHGKTVQNTVRYAAWRIERDPTTRVILWAYNHTLACKFSRGVRRIVEGRVPLAADRTAVEDWETTAGGGLRAAGVGAGITGMGANLIIIDDPVKNRAEADSLVYRDRCYESFTDDLYTRLEPGGAIVGTMTRWHDDDLAGRIAASEDASTWTTLNLTAVAEEGDPLGRPVGAALCPERFDETALARIAAVLGPNFEALYQGRPRPAGGEFFLRSWFEQFCDAIPADAERLRFWDKAGTLDGDYTCGVLVAKCRDGTFVVEDVVRGRWLSGEREKVIRQTAELDGPEVRIGVEQEPGSGGKDSARATIQNLAGFTVKAECATGEKSVRAGPFAAQCEAGNVRLRRGPWNRAWIDELCAFPRGTHDDQVDATSGAFNRLTRYYSAGAY